MMHHNQRRLVRAVAALSGAVLSCALLTVGTTTASAAPDLPTRDQASKQARTSEQAERPRPWLVPVQLLSFNDFHGNLEPPSGSSGRNVVDHAIDPDTGAAVDVTADAGGAARLATHLAKAREGHPNSLTVAAGDLIGGSPLLSAAFHDEPAIESLNALGLDVSAVGNHEFDEGYKELQRMADGGCIDDGPEGEDNQNSCPDPGHTFPGADFDYLAANVRYAGTDQSILPPYVVKEVGGAKIGFIGMTLEATPDIVTASGVAGLEFLDEVQTANALVPVLRSQGVNAIVVLIHQGGEPDKQSWKDPATGRSHEVNPTYDYTCGGGGNLIPARSPILPIAANLHPAIDMVVSGHTHQPYVCDVKDPVGQSRLLTSASSFGRLFTETNLVYDRRASDIVRGSVEGGNVQVTRDVTADPAQVELIKLYNQLVAPIAGEVVGRVTGDVLRAQNPAGESQLGDLIADAQLADPSVVSGGQTPVIAFMNPGGIRADLTSASSLRGEAPGDITYEEAFTVQPFNNYLVSMTLTGQQIYDVLAQQVTGANAAAPKVLQVSKGFSYRLGATGAVEGSVQLNGTPIEKSASYRIVTNNFLSDGGDSFPAFVDGTAKYVGGLDIDAFSAYLTANSPYTPAALDRITK